jgi:hypothetical protein
MLNLPEELKPFINNFKVRFRKRLDIYVYILYILIYTVDAHKQKSRESCFCRFFAWETFEIYSEIYQEMQPENIS